MPSPKVFICYAHADNESSDPRQRWLDRVRCHLHPFERQGDFEVICDEVLELGDNWHDRIQSQLLEARVVLLLVSSAFLASRYVASSEIPVLLHRAKTDGVRIIPVIVSPCAFDTIQFRYPDAKTGPERRKLSSLQSAGTPKESLSEVPYGRQERILKEVAVAVAHHVTSPSSLLHGAESQIPPLARPPSSDFVAPLAAPSSALRSPTPMPPASESNRDWTNSLGLRFVPVPGTAVHFCVWLTPVQDYEAFVRDQPDVDGSWKNPLYQKVLVTPGPTHPVVNVSWDDAKRFCEWLTQTEHRAGRLTKRQYYRLPTDLEWSAAVGLSGERGETPAARDGNIPGVYPWGTQWPPPSGSGNFADESARMIFPTFFNTIAGYRDGYATTSPVGEFNPSKDGLFDLAGNVWEWCEDWCDAEQKGRVLRGGSWSDVGPRYLLSSCRNNSDPGGRSSIVGFRVVLVGLGSACKVWAA